MTDSLQGGLSRSVSKSSALARNRSVTSGRHSRTPSAGQIGYQMMPIGFVGANGEGLDQREGGFDRDNSRKQPQLGVHIEYALVIDGQCLAYILAEDELQERFLQICINCSSVLCCRVSPRQKAQITTLVRKGLGKRRLCLAIGDGANDVGMIQAANVGVGITGVEGAQVLLLLVLPSRVVRKSWAFLGTGYKLCQIREKRNKLGRKIYIVEFEIEDDLHACS